MILRRYTRDWAAPDDRKVNPWDVNEPDPTDTGTMGTIPGPVIDSDGAYPLAPPNPGQPIGAGEASAWATVGVSDHNRVPPPKDPGRPVQTAATYDYHWNTFGWPSTAGVWLYHDHSVCDMENVEHGAIGIIVIHNPDDTQDVDIRDPEDPAKYIPALLPGGVVNSSPVRQDGGGEVFVDPQ